MTFQAAYDYSEQYRYLGASLLFRKTEAYSYTHVFGFLSL